MNKEEKTLKDILSNKLEIKLETLETFNSTLESENENNYYIPIKETKYTKYKKEDICGSMDRFLGDIFNSQKDYKVDYDFDYDADDKSFFIKVAMIKKF